MIDVQEWKLIFRRPRFADLKLLFRLLRRVCVEICNPKIKMECLFRVFRNTGRTGLQQIISSRRPIIQLEVTQAQSGESITPNLLFQVKRKNLREQGDCISKTFEANGKKSSSLLDVLVHKPYLGPSEALSIVQEQRLEDLKRFKVFALVLIKDALMEFEAQLGVDILRLFLQREVELLSSLGKIAQ